MKQLLVALGLVAVGSAVSSAADRPHVNCAAEDLLGRWDVWFEPFWCKIEINHGTIKQLACDPRQTSSDPEHPKFTPVFISGKLATTSSCYVTGNVIVDYKQGNIPNHYVYDFTRVLMDTGDDKRNFQGYVTVHNFRITIFFEAHYYNSLPLGAP